MGQKAENGCPTTSGRSGSGFDGSGTAGRGRLSGAGESPSSPSPSSSSPSSAVSAELLPLAASSPALQAGPVEDALAFLDEAVARFVAELRREGKAEGTIKAYGRHLTAFVLYLRRLPKPPPSLADLTTDVVMGYRDHEIAREKRSRGTGLLSARSVQMSVKALRSFFRHLLAHDDLLLDPTHELRGPRLPLRLPRDVPTPRQMKRLLSSPDTTTPLGKRDRAILELLYGTGLRNAELCALRRGDVDLERRTVYVRKGKGGKERVVPMGKSAARSLTDYLGAYAELAGGRAPHRDLPLFLAKTGRAIGSHVLRKLMRRHLLTSRVDVKATPHSLRHACATHLLKGGADIRQIQSLLGHASLEATQIYTKVDSSDLLKMLDRHHPRGRDHDEP